MHSLPLRSLALACLALLLAGCSATNPEAGEAEPSASRPPASPSATFLPTPTATPAPTPTPTPTPTVAPTRQTARRKTPPVRIRLGSVKAVGSDNAILFDGRQRRPEQRAARRAAQAATSRLERYVTEAFVRPRSRTTASPFRDFLDGEARVTASRAAKRALGRLPRKVREVQPLRGNASALVLMNGAHAVDVALRYRAVLEGKGPHGRRVAIVQRGTAVLVKPAAVWRATALNVELVLRGIKSRKARR